MSTSECRTCYNPRVSFWSCLHRYFFPVTFLTDKRDTSIARITANIPSGSEQANSVLHINVPHVQSWTYNANAALWDFPFSQSFWRGEGMLVTEQMKTACLEPQFSGVTSEESFSHGWKVCPNLAYEDSHCLIRDEITLYLFPLSEPNFHYPSANCPNT